MRMYYWETKSENGKFEADSEEAAIELTAKIVGLILLYRWSDTPDGLPIVVLATE